MAQEPRSGNEIAVRVAGVVPSALVDSIRTTIAALDPDLPLRRLEPAAARVPNVNYQDGVLGSVLSALALLGLGLACLGVYGVIARTVAQRAPEFGIRLVLGASAADINQMVLASGAKLALIGSGLGLVGAYGLAPLLTALFPGMHSNAAGVLIGATLLLLAIAQVAGYLPARDASRISPAAILRAE